LLELLKRHKFTSFCLHHDTKLIIFATYKTNKNMAQVSMTVRMDSQLKQNFDALCQQLGMSANAAMNIFANAVVRTRGIPFKVGLEEPKVQNPALRRFLEYRESLTADDSRPEMTLDEINEEIRLARKERAAKEKAGI
jgi:addiction module RelB/DinJ family antitoxin